jgi:hypothetical protein
MSWYTKAHRIIAELSQAAYRAAGNGSHRKRHVPYSVPETAEMLIDCLNRDDEERAKVIFIRIASGFGTADL